MRWMAKGGMMCASCRCRRVADRRQSGVCVCVDDY